MQAEKKNRSINLWVLGALSLLRVLPILHLKINNKFSFPRFIT